jgi:hypothetical protein
MVVVPSFLTISLSTGLFIGHPVGGLTGGEEHTYKTKERVTRTPLKTGVNSDAPEG